MINNIPTFNKFDDKNDEINLKAILDFFFRNKSQISLISLIFFILALGYSYSLKKIWEGEFQIVLNSEKPLVIRDNINPGVANLLGINKDNSLATEVGILQSPSILMPIFEFVESSKNKSEKEKSSFSSWKRNNLKVALEPGTSILNISYVDSNKGIIIPVLKKISNTYQEYSGEKKKRAIKLTKDYLKQQINISKEKSADSLKIVQDFAIEQDLIYEDIQEKDLTKMNKGKNFIEGSLLTNIGIEKIRVNSANEIRRIDLQIQKIRELGNDFDKLQYIGSTIPALVDEGLPTELAEIEAELVDKRTKYTDTDQTIVRINKKRDLLISVLKKRAISYLQAKRIEKEATMQAAMRPKGILIKYKELIRQAGRDESTLIALENELEFIELEEAKLEDPWQLITNPTLLADPVGPSKFNIGLLGLLSGFFISSGISIYKEKKSTKIFNISELEKLLNFEFLEEFSKEDLKTRSKKVLYLKEFVNKKLPEKFFIFTIGDIFDEDLKNLGEVIKDKNNSKKEIRVISSFEELSALNINDSFILFSSLSTLNYKDIAILKKFIDLNQICLEGIILINY